MSHIDTLSNGNLLVSVPHAFRKVSNRRRVLIATPKAAPPPLYALLNLIARSHQWRDRLRRGHYANLTTLAREVGFDPSYFYKLFNLVHLSPYVLDALLSGHLPPSITHAKLLQAAQEPLWERQHQLLGLIP